MNCSLNFLGHHQIYRFLKGIRRLNSLRTAGIQSIESGCVIGARHSAPVETLQTLRSALGGKGGTYQALGAGEHVDLQRGGSQRARGRHGGALRAAPAQRGAAPRQRRAAQHHAAAAAAHQRHAHHAGGIPCSLCY